MLLASSGIRSIKTLQLRVLLWMKAVQGHLQLKLRSVTKQLFRTMIRRVSSSSGTKTCCLSKEERLLSRMTSVVKLTIVVKRKIKLPMVVDWWWIIITWICSTRHNTRALDHDSLETMRAWAESVEVKPWELAHHAWCAIGPTWGSLTWSLILLVTWLMMIWRKRCEVPL